MIHALTICVAMLATSHATVDGAIDRTRAAVHQVMQENTVPAIAIAAALGGELVYEEAFGLATADPAAEATAATRFGIGSITKSLTLALVQVLVDRDELDWDVPIETWLDDFAYAGRGMTLRHIGAHQSGINDDRMNALRFTREHYTIDESVRDLVAGPLDFEPGTQTQYGTAAFSVIAQVIERVTDESFEAVLQREILDPAGMTQTSVLDPCIDVDHLTTFYEPRDGELVPVVVDASFKRAGAGYVCTAADLVRFGATLDAGKLCTTEDLFRPQQTADGTQSEFGLGWRVTEDEGRFVVYQPGGGPGISAYLVIYPDQDLVWAVVCNETAAPVGGAIMGESLAGFLELAE